MYKILIIAALTASGVLAGSPALGCPYCKSDIGQKVAAGLFNEDFAFNALVTLLPVPILFLIVAVIHFGWPWSMAESQPDTEADEHVQNEPHGKIG